MKLAKKVSIDLNTKTIKISVGDCYKIIDGQHFTDVDHVCFYTEEVEGAGMYVHRAFFHQGICWLVSAWTSKKAISFSIYNFQDQKLYEDKLAFVELLSVDPTIDRPLN